MAIVFAYGVIAKAALDMSEGNISKEEGAIWGVTLCVVGWLLMTGVQNLIHNFNPQNALDAKRLNEQVKLIATMLNTVAAATVSVIALAEVSKKHDGHPDMRLIVAAIGAGLYVHMGARGLLLHLKDDTTSAYPVPPRKRTTGNKSTAAKKQ